MGLAGEVEKKSLSARRRSRRTSVVPVFTVGHTVVGAHTADRMAGRSDISDTDVCPQDSAMCSSCRAVNGALSLSCCGETSIPV